MACERAPSFLACLEKSPVASATCRCATILGSTFMANGTGESGRVNNFGAQPVSNKTEATKSRGIFFTVYFYTPFTFRFKLLWLK